MSEELTRRIKTLIMPSIENSDAELIELNIRRQGSTAFVEVVADKESGGITIDECSRINKDIFQRLERAQVIGEDFVVEVASPGLDRPLKTEKDFGRARGWNVRVHLCEAVEGKREYLGFIQGVEENKVIIKIKQKIVRLPIENIHKAVQVF
jgi:ribosome maturation factor RimP